MAETERNVIGIAMELDVADLKAGLAEVNKEIKQSKQVFATATASLDNWQKSTDGVTAKLTQLNTQLSLEAKAIAGYKAEIERVSKLEGDHTLQLDRLRTKLAGAEAAFKVTQGQIKRYNRSLEELNKANISASINAARTALSKFGNELKKVTKAQLAQNIAMLANPYALAASAVGFLIGKVSEYIRKKKEESEAEKEANEKKKQAVETLKAYNEAMTGFVSSISRVAKTYSELIAQERAFNAAAKEIKESVTEDGNQFVKVVERLNILADGYQRLVNSQRGESNQAKLIQKRMGEMSEDAVLLTANMIDLGKSEEDVSAYLQKIGFNANAVGIIFAEAKKRVDDFNEANKKAEGKDTKPAKKEDEKTDAFAETDFSKQKKAYDEYMKWMQARRYKFAEYNAQTAEEMKAVDTSVIDSHIKENEKLASDYIATMNRLKNAAKGTAEDIGKTTDNVADKGKNAAEKFVEAWEKALPGINISMKQIFSTLDSLAKQVQDTVNSVIDAVSAYWNNYYDERKKELEESAETETEQREHNLSEIERQYMNYEITLDEFKAKKAEIEQDITDQEGTQKDERAAKEEEIERERDAKQREIFEAQKASDIAMLWIQSSIGQVTAVVNAIRDLGFPAGPIVGGITAGAILTQTIAETVAMASQQYVSAFAKGGIVNRPTLGLVGEAGKEAIMPLENNTEWISDLAKKITILQRVDLAAGISNGNNYNYGGDTFNNQKSTYNYTQVINAPKTPSRLDLYRDGKRLLTIGRG